MNDTDLHAAVAGCLGPTGTVRAIRRQRSPYATSFAIEDVVVSLADNRELPLILKRLAPRSMLEDARRTKPRFLYDPRRERCVYERILPAAPAGPARCYAAGDTWLLLEKVEGLELYQIGDVDTWAGAARWFARMHARVPIGEFDDAPLIRVDGDYLRRWMERAVTFTADRRVASLGRRYDAVVDQLVAMRPVFVHGEAYASNVLVAPGRVCPVDWEMAGCGPALLDVAALITGSGWTDADRAIIVRAYFGGEPDATALADLDACRLQLAVQWLGWSPSWRAPSEHSHDWLREALQLAERLDL